MRMPILFRLFFLFCALGCAALVAANVWVVTSAEPYVYRGIRELPEKYTILVPGAQARGTWLSPVLRDRVEAGAACIREGKGGKLLLTGDHGRRGYDEVNAMRLYILEHSDIPAENIFTDHAGFSTWDSVYRAGAVFGARELIIVTQEFHIARAVFLARSLGIDAAGLALDEQQFLKKSRRFWRLREFFARGKAAFCAIVKPKPRYLGESIPIRGDGRTSWDTGGIFP
jgi:SanA protein